MPSISHDPMLQCWHPISEPRPSACSLDPGTRHQRSSAPVGVEVSHDAPPPRVVWNPQLWAVAKPMGTEQSHDFASELPNQIVFRFQQHQLWMAGSHSCYNTLSVRSANNRCIDPYSMQSGEYLCACVCISNMQEHMAYRLTCRYICNAYLLNLSLILISWLAVIKKRCTWDDNMSKKNQQVTYESGCPMGFRSFDFLNQTGWRADVQFLNKENIYRLC